MLYAAPGQIGHVNQTVDAADINERAEVRQTANSALHDGTNLEGVPNLLLLFSFFSNQNRLAGRDDALLRLVDLDDLQRHRLTYELVDLLDIVQRQLGCGDEGADAHNVCQQTALNGFLANAFDEFARFFLRADVFPSLAVDDVLLGKKDVAFAVINFDDFDFDFVADLDIGRGKVGLFDQTIRLVADVYAHFVIGDLNHLTGHNLAGAQLDKRLVNVFHGHYGLILGFFDGGFLLDVVHSCNNLLNYTIRCGCTGCNPDCIGRADLQPFELVRRFNETCLRTDLRRQRIQLPAV